MRSLITLSKCHPAPVDETLLTSFFSENFPHELATQDSNIILVGGTDENGRLRPQTSPGRDDHPITVYAPSRLPGYDLADGETQESLYGTSFSAPQVVSSPNAPICSPLRHLLTT